MDKIDQKSDMYKWALKQNSCCHKTVQPPWLIRRNLIAKYVIIQTVVVFSFFTLLHIFNNLLLLALFDLILLAGVFGVWKFFKSGYFDVAKHLISSSLFFIVFIFFGLVGPDANLWMAMLSAIAVPLVIFDLRQWKQILIHILEPFFYFSILSLSNNMSMIRLDLDPVLVSSIAEWTLICSFLNFLFSIIFLNVGSALSDVHEENISEKLKNENRWVSLLQQLGTIANSAKHLDQAMRESLKLIRKFSGYQIGHVIYIQEGLEDRCHMSKIWSESKTNIHSQIQLDAASLDYETDASIPVRVLEEGGPLWFEISDLMLTPRSAGFAAAGIKSAFAFPVKIKNETVAILYPICADLALPARNSRVGIPLYVVNNSLSVNKIRAVGRENFANAIPVVIATNNKPVIESKITTICAKAVFGR
jgi:hypothetical protein